jgi:hypothetical protein
MQLVLAKGRWRELAGVCDLRGAREGSKEGAGHGGGSVCARAQLQVSLSAQENPTAIFWGVMWFNFANASGFLTVYGLG